MRLDGVVVPGVGAGAAGATAPPLAQAQGSASAAGRKVNVVDVLGTEMTAVIWPVSICMLAVVVLVRLLHPEGTAFLTASAAAGKPSRYTKEHEPYLLKAVDADANSSVDVRAKTPSIM